jgi:prepilin-type N-terminal cleavage/methylation domain-containing protein
MMSRRCGSGFSLIEVLVALVILSTGIVLVLRAFSTAITGLDEGRDVLRMQGLVRDVLDRTGAAVEGRGGSPAQTSGRFAAPNQAFAWEVNVSPVPGTGNGTESLCRVSAGVWREGTGRRCAAETYAYGVWR